MRLSNTSLFSPIMLDEKIHTVPNSIQILRTGKFQHPNYGMFEITSKTLADMKSNFDNRIRGIDVSFDYYHDSNEDASAWVKNINLNAELTELWADVEWTPKATQKLADRELRYFSPDFAFEWKDPESGKVYQNVLFGGGLTNRPFVKEMKAIVADEIRSNNMTELEQALLKVKELEANNIKLSEDKSMLEKQMQDMPKPDRVSELEAQIAALQAELQKAKGEAEIAMAEKNKICEEKRLAEKESAFNILLTEGKACAAQKDAYMKDNMVEFIKLAQPVNLSPAGKNAQELTESEKIEKIFKLAEQKKNENKKLSHADAISLAKKEIEKE